MKLFLARIAVRVLPKWFVEWYRRRRALRRYLRALAYEIFDRQVRLDMHDLEGRMAARRDGFYDRMVKDVLERTELILQELDRKIEGVTARHGSQLRELRREVEGLRADLAALDGLGAPSTDRPGTARARESAPALDR